MTAKEIRSRITIVKRPSPTKGYSVFEAAFNVGACVTVDNYEAPPLRDSEEQLKDEIMYALFADQRREFSLTVQKIYEAEMGRHRIGSDELCSKGLELAKHQERTE